MNIYLETYVLSIFISVLNHLLVSYQLKKRFKKYHMHSQFIMYYEDYKKKRKLADRLMYSIYLVPILNIMISGIELIQLDNTFFNVMEDVKAYSK